MVIYFLLTVILLLFFLPGIKKEHATLIVIAHLLRGIFSLINIKYSFFDPKEAGDYSLLLYDFWKSQEFGLSTLLFSLVSNTFTVQAFLCSLGFSLFGIELFVVILTNNLVVSLAVIISLKILKKSGSFGLNLVAALTLFPSVINFCMFGLRDPIIYSLIAILYSLFVSSLKYRSLYMLLCIIPLLFLRGELFLIYLLPFSFDFLKRYKFVDRTTLQFRIKKMMLLSFAVALMFPLIVKTGTYLAFGSSMDIDSVVGHKLERRHSVAIENGGNSGSHIYSTSSVKSLGFGVKWFVQTAALVLNPFPWSIRSVSHLLAFFESVLLIILLFKAKRVLYLFSERRFMVISYILGILLLGVMVINFGNGFRMRFALLPIILIAMFFKELAKNDQ